MIISCPFSPTIHHTLPWYGCVGQSIGVCSWAAGDQQSINQWLQPLQG